MEWASFAYETGPFHSISAKTLVNELYLMRRPSSEDSRVVQVVEPLPQGWPCLHPYLIVDYVITCLTTTCFGASKGVESVGVLGFRTPSVMLDPPYKYFNKI
uniref:Uncharacterized protein n=1 Tax=Timema tahoe TaxID=61484 RepID=A0A7R9IJI1_9NEOP|nr:unnamed protein product [Timema tahoe]